MPAVPGRLDAGVRALPASLSLMTLAAALKGGTELEDRTERVAGVW
jgi:hypothetical protein